MKKIFFSSLIVTMSINFSLAQKVFTLNELKESCFLNLNEFDSFVLKKGYSYWTANSNENYKSYIADKKNNEGKNDFISMTTMNGNNLSVSFGTTNKSYYLKFKEKLKKKKYKKERYANDPEYKTSCLLRKQTQRLGDYKNTSTIDLIGCSAHDFWLMNGEPSIEELKDLHIDHVVPISWFDLSNEDHVKVCNHYLNLQYLSSEDNLSKGARYMGSPDNIIAYRKDFNIHAHVAEMLVIIDQLN